MGNCSLLQGIFPTQGLNLGLLHCRKIIYHLSHQGSPSIYIKKNPFIELLFSLALLSPPSLSCDPVGTQANSSKLFIFSFSINCVPILGQTLPSSLVLTALTEACGLENTRGPLITAGYLYAMAWCCRSSDVPKAAGFCCAKVESHFLEPSLC